MAKRNDVELVISARDQAQAAIRKVVGAMRDLSGAQDDTAASSGRANSALGALGAELTTLKSNLDGIRGLSDIASDIADLERSIAKLEAKPPTDRRTQLLAEMRAELARLKASAEEAAKGLGVLETSQESLRAAADQTRSAIRSVEAVLRTQGRLPQEAAPTLAPAAESAANLRQSIAATEQARASWRAAQGEASRLGAAIAATVAPTVEQRTAFQLARVAVQNAKTAYEQQAAATNALRGSMQGGFAAFEQTAQAIQRQSREAGAAKAANDAYARSFTGVVRQLLGLKAPAQQAAAAVNQAAAATRNASSAGGRAPFLGLEPWQLQNLSFQINDVVTGLATGQRPMQVFLQQGAQIVQIVPRLALAFLKWAPAIGAVVGVFATLYSAMKRIADQAATMRQFDSLLTANADGAAYSAERIAEYAQELDTLSGSLADARKMLAAFINEGVDESALLAFGQAAQNTARVLGIELPEAAQKVAEAFTADYEAVAELDRGLNFLTQAERAHIRELFESGQAAEARTEALRIYSEQMHEAAENSRGPWSEAARELSRAWDEIVSSIAGTGIVRGASKLIDDMAAATARWARSLRTVVAYLREGGEGVRRVAREQAAEAQAPAVAGDTIDTDSERARKAREDRERAEAERRRQQAERAAESAAQRAAGFHADIRAQIADREFEASLIGRTARETAVLTALREAELQAREAGTRVSAAELEALQASIILLEQRREAFEAETAVREAETALADAQRIAAGREITREQHIQNEAQQRGVDLATELGQRFAEVQGEIFDVTQAHRDMEAALQRALEIERQRERAVREWRVAQADGTPAAAVGVLRERVDELTASLAESTRQARALATELGNESTLARLDEINLRVEETAEKIVTAQQANQMVASGLTDSIGDAAESIGAAINGTLSWGDAIRNVGDAFRSFAADFLKRIAQMILQAAILKALQSGGWGGLVEGAVSAVTRHTGGLASQGPRRTVPAYLFANAPRYHGGGLPGLQAGEVAAILRKGEEVLAEDDPRNVLNGGASGGSQVNVKNVNIFDQADMLEAAVKTRRGEKVLLNFVSANRTAFRAALGD